MALRRIGSICVRKVVANSMPTLVLSSRYTDDAQALWKAAAKLGWNVERLVGWRVPETLKAENGELALYVEALFGPMVAEELGVRLIDPPEDWLVRLPFEYRLREIRLSTLGEARSLKTPHFIKPPNDKSFPAAVYFGNELPDSYDEVMPVLVSDVVSWRSEFRCFLLNRSLVTYSVYARQGELQREREFHSDAEEDRELEAFMTRLTEDDRVDFPPAIVIDVGYIEGEGWACVELNAAWGAGIYGCDPERVLEVVRRATTR